MGEIEIEFSDEFSYFLWRRAAAAVALYHKLNWNSGRRIFLVPATHVMHEMHIGAIDAGQLINSCWLGGVEMWRGFDVVCCRFAVSINYRSANGTFPQNLINDGPAGAHKIDLEVGSKPSSIARTRHRSLFNYSNYRLEADSTASHARAKHKFRSVARLWNANLSRRAGNYAKALFPSPFTDERHDFH